MKQADVLRVLLKYSAAYPSFSLKRDGCELYLKALQQFDVDDIDKAMCELLKKCKFFPTIAEIYEQIEKNIESDNKFTPENGYI